MVVLVFPNGQDPFWTSHWVPQKWEMAKGILEFEPFPCSFGPCNPIVSSLHGLWYANFGEMSLSQSRVNLSYCCFHVHEKGENDEKLRWILRSSSLIEHEWVTLVPTSLNNDWLVVDLPLWKIWVRQLGWWNSQYMGKIIQMFQTTNQMNL